MTPLPVPISIGRPLMSAAALGRRRSRSARCLTGRGSRPAPGQYDFAVYDNYVLEAAAHGLAILPVLHNPPDFYRAAAAHGDGARRRTSPQWPATRARPCSATGLTARSGGRIPARPACRCARGRSGTSPISGSTGATTRTRASTRACCASSARPSRARIPARRSSRPDMPDSKLKSAMPLDRLPQAPLSSARQALLRHARDQLVREGQHVSCRACLKHIRKLMNRKHDRRARIWITEIGWGDCLGPPIASSSAPRARRFASRTRSSCSARWDRSCASAASSTTRGATCGPYPPNYNDMWGLHTGLLDLNGNPKPAYNAFRRAVATGLR